MPQPLTRIWCLLKNSVMDEMTPWHYVFCTQETLVSCGIEFATPVHFESGSGIIEILDSPRLVNEWVVRTRPESIELLCMRCGVEPIYMTADCVMDFAQDSVQLSEKGRRLLSAQVLQNEFLKNISGVI